MHNSIFFVEELHVQNGYHRGSIFSFLFVKASEEVEVDDTASESCDITGEKTNSHNPAHCFDTDAGKMQIPENPRARRTFSKNSSDTADHSGQEETWSHANTTVRPTGFRLRPVGGNRQRRDDVGPPMRRQKTTQMSVRRTAT